MKKILIFLFLTLIILMLAGCGNNSNTTNESTLTLNDAKDIFVQQGAELQSDKPYFEMIGAEDGYILYLDDNPIKIYSFESESSYNDALEEFPMLQDMPKKDLIVLESSYDKAIEIFNNISK